MLSTINCTSDKQQALELASADSIRTMYVFQNINISLSKGKLIAAPINWISPDPSEQEWVILPLKVLKMKVGQGP
ncbi:MAG: hypothetical protein GY739_09010 [Mesoflavibacter sp.]|nr:hypothetical protein [Mesoflavibacter sp.]